MKRMVELMIKDDKVIGIDGYLFEGAEVNTNEENGRFDNKKQ